ncbi:hypothetical protein BK816_06320 [Boudabousia tangfeifanii]|uniref:AI-2E family transporter n=1 Tax=Boudabousia tangfeifanii TaxID=1912795 RepID=A0A1D9MKY7_9ACTO|nr:AI-2E family transporter [Boudabousia tangfeifanii]AOZ72952.1 hypothetical protein BK816_06320 [Boudabousia tangfeifanii]
MFGKLLSDTKSNKSVKVRKPIYKVDRRDAKDAVSYGVRVAAAWSWRILVIAGVSYLLIQLGAQLSMVLVPVMISLLFTAMLAPMVRFLTIKLHFPRALSALTALIIGTGVVATLLSVAIGQMINGAPSLAYKASAGFNTLMDWISDGPLGVKEAQVTQWIQQAGNQLTAAVKANVSSIASGAFFAASTAASSLATIITILFCVFFFLKDGREIWLWLVHLTPRNARRAIHESAYTGWQTVGAWARVQVLVAAIDAVGIGTGAYFLGVSLWGPIALTTFLAGFIPMVGAIVAGALAVLVALVDVGPTAALIMLIIVLVVQQLEGNVLQPFLMASAVALHPVAVLLGVTAGGYLVGILGALFTVPVMAFFNAAISRAASADAYENKSGDSDEDLYLVDSDDSDEEEDEAEEKSDQEEKADA